jgi:hypothetical protein
VPFLKLLSSVQLQETSSYNSNGKKEILTELISFFPLELYELELATEELEAPVTAI